jgi:hypothetical protein
MRLAVILFLVVFTPLLSYAQDDGWQVAKSTHFNVFYKNASESAVSELIQKAEDCYNSIADDLGFNRFNFWTWDNRAKIYLYDNQDEYKKATQSYDWSTGRVKVSSKTIQSYSGAPGFLDNILPHELAHIIFIEMVGFNNPGVPLWLHEGVASYQEKDIYSVKADLAKQINQGRYINFSALNNFRLGSSSSERIRLFYEESYSLVKYLVSEFGKEEFVNFCRSLRDRHSLLDALTKTYSFKDFNDFEESWKQYILE